MELQKMTGVKQTSTVNGNCMMPLGSCQASNKPLKKDFLSFCRAFRRYTNTAAMLTILAVQYGYRDGDIELEIRGLL